MAKLASPDARRGNSAAVARRLTGRVLKLGAAATIVYLAVRAIASGYGYVGTNNAVVSAQITVLRAPIEGYVAAGEITEGQELKQAAPVQTISSTKQQDAQLADLETDLKRLLKQRDAAQGQREALASLLRDLKDRATAGNAAQVARISAIMESDRNKAGSAETRRQQLERDYERKLSLLRSGNAAPAEVDRLRSDVIAAAQEVSAANAATQADLSARDAAQGGVLSEPGSNDVTYSIQRADEVRIVLIQVDRSITDLNAAAEQARERLEAARRYNQTSAIIRAPISGMVWKVGAINGERVSPGDVVLEMVDCGRAFIVASIPQYRMSDVLPGGEARFRFVGEDSERVARVVSIESAAAAAREGRFAALPQSEREATALVTLAAISTPNSANQCLVGRTARVLVPLRKGGALRDWTQRLGLDQIWRGLTS
ncbi:MAG: HlyD family efflux transporter periplasmic adaptor subunit [Acetobacteraceae bacterium]|nr:HlyD family efflux transporter periplasmic adaptor subunit [Acetobacteraceae bacterium]